MQRLISGLSLVAATLAIATALGGAAVQAQAPTGNATGVALQTPWGDPDLQGIWVGSTLTPLERPPQFEGREFLTEEEVAALENGAVTRNVQLAERPAESTTAGGSVDWREDGTPGFYNNFWLDGGTAWGPERRTSLVVDPPDGRIPYTATARDNERPHGSGPWNSFLDLDTGERCLGDGLPQIWFGYNPNHQIFQTAEHVVIVHEMFNQRRIIPLDGRPHVDITRWNGEPRGRWEGDTLVVESRDFPDRPHDRWGNTWRVPTSQLHLVERFTRVDAETIDYEATITDANAFHTPVDRALPRCRRTSRSAAWRRGTCSSSPATRGTTPSATSCAAHGRRTTGWSRRTRTRAGSWSVPQNPVRQHPALGCYLASCGPPVCLITLMAVAMIEETSATLAGTIIVLFSLASRPSFSTYCSATRNCTA